MRHLKAGRRLGRTSSHRKAMYRNMVTSLVIHGRIRTTLAKAKELRKVADRMVTLGKGVAPSSLESAEGDELHDLRVKRVHYIRRAARTIQDRAALDILFNDLAGRFEGRAGGYTRVLKAGFRPGDNAPMAIIEFVGTPRPVTEEGELAGEVAGEE
jgi:large subunit ribosomal protein L17